MVFFSLDLCVINVHIVCILWLFYCFAVSNRDHCLLSRNCGYMCDRFVWSHVYFKYAFLSHLSRDTQWNNNTKRILFESIASSLFFRSSNQSIGRLVNGSCVYVIFQLFSGCARVHHLRNLLYGFVNNLFQLCFCSQKWRHTNEIIRYAIKSLNTTYSTLSFILMSFSQVNCCSFSK